MTAHYSLMLIAFLAGLAILLVRYVNATVDKEFRNLARAASDEEFRSGELARTETLLARQLPLPAGISPLKGPVSNAWNALPPALMGIGVILLWGTGAAREDRELWFAGALTALVLASVIMLATLRRRKWERTARLLRFRADLKRMDGDRAGAAADLRELLKLTPWDDAAWAELSEDRDAVCETEEALDAIDHAVRLDPGYEEYRMLEASLALRLGRLEQARAAVESWKNIGGLEGDDPRPAAYLAAIELAGGHRDKAEELLKGILLDAPDDEGREFLDTEQALAGVRKLLPGNVEEQCER